MVKKNNKWENAYSKGQHNSIWPWSDVISLFHRNLAGVIKNNKTKVLELGCGAGANIPFILSLGLQYYGIDGSKTAVSNLKKKYKNLANKLYVADFSEQIPINLPEKFDIIFDKASITHNNSNEIIKTINNIKTRMSKNAYFVGVMWFASDHSAFKEGIEIDDKYTKTNLPRDTEFYRIGKVHFSTENYIKNLFKDFKIVILEKKITKHALPKRPYLESSWNIVAKKISS